MPSESKLFGLIADLYAAAGDGQLWAVFLENLAEAMPAGPTSLLYYDRVHNIGNIAINVRLDPHRSKQYTEYFGARDPWGLNGKELLVAGAILPGQMLVDDAIYEKTEFYQDFMRPMGLFHQVAAVIEHSDSMIAAISSIRPKEAGPYGDTELLLLTTLMPHFQQALKLHAQLARLQW
jgi:hypothetical protein